MEPAPALDFAPGAVIRFQRGEYSHLAISLGRGRVIHLWSPSSTNFRVRIDFIRGIPPDAQGRVAVPESYTAALDAKMLHDHALEPFEAEMVLHRARTRLGETDYSPLSYNCEHFVTWARYGLGASPQVASHSSQVLAGALLGGMVGGVAGLVVGGLISLFAKADALNASAAGASSGGLLMVETAEASDREDSSTAEDAYSRAARAFESSSGHNSSSGDEHEEPAPLDREQLWQRVREPIVSPWAEEQEPPVVQPVVARPRPARPYSDDRHLALATRLAEDKLQCRFVLVE